MASLPRAGFAVFAIFLLLSSSPIDATRVARTNNAIQKSLGSVSSDVQWGASCATMERRFHSRTQSGVGSVQHLRNANGTAGFQAVSSTMFSMWSMVRIVRRAHRKECAWASDVDVSGLQEIMQATLRDNPCLAVAEERIGGAGNASKDEQAEVFLTSMGMLMTGECEAQPMTQLPEENHITEPESEDDAAEQVDELMDDLADVNLDEEAAAAFLQMGAEQQQPQQVAQATLRFWPPPFWTGVDRWLIRTQDVVWEGHTIIQGSTTAIQSAGPGTAAEWIVHGLGVAAWLIGFAMVCTTAVYLFALIIGALICLLRSLLMVLLMRTTSLQTCLHNTVNTVSSYRGAIGMVGGVCLAAGAGLITTTGGVVGMTVIR